MWNWTPRLAVTAAMGLGLFAAIPALSAEEQNPNDRRESQDEQIRGDQIQGDANRPQLDVVFVMDATGSMSDEIDVVKKQIWSIAEEIASGDPAPYVRFGLVFYRDKSDEWTLRSTDFTRDLDAIHEKLMSVRASGGGDHAEHVVAGLDRALRMDWAGGAGISRSIYLVGDAAAHTDYSDATTLAAIAERASARGISINGIGGSGIDRSAGERQFAELADRTGGTYENLTYHAVVEGEDGEEKSVVYHDGKHYEADEKLDDGEWSRGAQELKEEGRLESADSASRRKAQGKKKENNLDDVVKDEMKSSAGELGVDY